MLICRTCQRNHFGATCPFCAQERAAELRLARAAEARRVQREASALLTQLRDAAAAATAECKGCADLSCALLQLESELKDKDKEIKNLQLALDRARLRRAPKTRKGGQQ